MYLIPLPFSSGTKRLRIFAGPNGSGKSTLVANLPKQGQFKVNIFVNADEIEKQLNKSGGMLHLGQFQLPGLSSGQIQEFIGEHGMSPQKVTGCSPLPFSIDNDVLYYRGAVNSYIAADIAAFIRKTLLEQGISFTFENVFSHESKLQIMENARHLGYRVYLYFITTEDADINVSRVHNRVKKGGHSVPEDRIRSRYTRSLEQLKKAVKCADRVFLFDNSSKAYRYITEITGGRADTAPANDNIPNWFIDYIFSRKGQK